MKGGGAQAIVRAAGLASAAITTPLLARHLGAAGFGRFVIAVTVGWVVATVADLGLPLAASRDLPQLDASARASWLSAFWSLRLWSATMVTVASVLVVITLALGAEITAAVTVALMAVPLMLLTNALSSLFLAELDPWPATWSEATARASWIVGLVLAVWLDAGLVMILGILVATQAAGAVMLVLPARRRHLLAKPSAGTNVLPLALAAAPLGILPLLGMVYARADTLVMAALVSDAETGMYGAMWRLVEALVSVASIGAALLLPLLAMTAQRDQQRAHYLRALRLLMMVLLPAVAGVAVMASPILGFFGGSGFFVEVETSWGVVSPTATLVVLMGSLALMGVGIIHGAVMVATHRQAALIRQSAMVVVVNLTLAWMLIPRLSFLGAAIAVLATEVLSIVHSTWVVRGAVGPFALREVMAWPVVIASTAVAPVLVLNGAPVTVRLVVGAAAAAAVAWRSSLRSELTALLGSRAEAAV